MNTIPAPATKERRKLISAGILLENNGKYLIVNPYQNTGTTKGWGVPKGKQDPGEGLLDTALREFYEETGLKIHANQILKKKPVVYEFNGKDKTGKFRKTVHVFFAKVEGKDLSKYPFECLTFVDEEKKKPEIAEFKWVSPNKAMEMVVKKQRDIFKDL